MNVMERTRWLLAGLMLSMATTGWATPVAVYLEPNPSVVRMNDIFNIDILAEIPLPVLGFGLDVDFEPSILKLVSAPVIGSGWIPVPSTDGDGLVGLAFPALSGSNVLLATLTFEALTTTLPSGTDIRLSTTAGDYTEGFPLAFPAPPGTFSEAIFQDTTVFVSEPAVVNMLLLGLAMVGFLNRRHVNQLPAR
jgi:hypothetical protein